MELKSLNLMFELFYLEQILVVLYMQKTEKVVRFKKRRTDIELTSSEQPKSISSYQIADMDFTALD